MCSYCLYVWFYGIAGPLDEVLRQVVGVEVLALVGLNDVGQDDVQELL